MTDKKKPRVLVVADHCVDTGFARVAQNICPRILDYWDVCVVGINYNGIPHSFPYKVWPAKLYGDIWGLGTLNYLIHELRPDAILAIQDPWIVARYATEIDRLGIPMVAYMPVDAKNQHPSVCQRLNSLDLAVFYTKFGEVEIRIPGFTGRGCVIPHGVNRDIYRPVPKAECRSRLRMFEDNDDSRQREIGDRAFVVGNVNRNQPRKRLDLTVQYFAEWLRRVQGDRRQRIEDAYLYLHCSQRDSNGWDLTQLAHYYGIANRLILPDPAVVTPAKGLLEEDMPYVYGCFDVQVSTTAGEGWGLSQIEGMACGIPQIVPQYAALGEWAAGAAYMVPCADERVTHAVINTVGAVPEKESFIRALDLFYRDPEMRSKYAGLALAKASKPEFSWDKIAIQFHECLKDVVIRAGARAMARERETLRREKKGNDETPEAAASNCAA